MELWERIASIIHEAQDDYAATGKHIPSVGIYARQIVDLIPDNTRPAPDMPEYEEAKDLAVSIWKRHYFDDSREWEPLDTIGGVLSQISNMVSGLQRTPDIDKEIEWVGECPGCEGRCYQQAGDYKSGCIDCNGTGEITRQATLEEGVEGLKRMISRIKRDEPPTITACLTINKGRLRIKE